MEEIWVDIKGYEGLYQVSNLGRVKSLERTVKHSSGGDKIVKERILKGSCNNNGYVIISLNKNGNKKSFAIHNLVAKAFIPNEDNKPYVDHIDTNKTNNKVDNLRWVTEKENSNNELTRKHISKNRKGKGILYGIDNPKSKKVVQLTKDYNIVKIWNCINEAEREEGYLHSDIIKCCNKKRKTHKGYIWMYYEDYIKLNEKGE